MADLLTHALVAYSIAVMLSYRYDWLTTPYVTVCMMGSFIPDMTKVSLALSSDVLEGWLGVPFDWFALHTVGGSFVSVLVGTVLVPGEYRKRVFGLLALGAASHLILDALLLTPSGHMSPMLWPLTDYQFAIPGVYLSSDRWPAVVSAGLAAVVWYVRYRRYPPAWHRTSTSTDR